MAGHGGQHPQQYPNQPWSGPPGYGAAPASGPPGYHQPVSGALVPVSGAAYPGMPAEQPLCQIGDVIVTTSAVRTPIGGCPLRGSQWLAQDQWIASQKTPTWAIVLAIVGFCFVAVFSLLFLLAKENVVSGVVQVTITNGAFTYVTRVPVHDQMMAQHVHNQVNYARAMALR